MNFVRWFFAERQTYLRYEHSGTINLLRFLFCFATAVTVAGYGPEYDFFFQNAQYDPIPFFRTLAEPPMSLATFRVLRWTLVGMLTIASLGLLTRPLLVASAIAFVAYEGTNLGFTKPLDSDYAYHMTNLAPFFMLIMAIAPGIDRHTIVTTLRGRNEPTLLPEWPRKAMIGMIAFAYFGAGYCRVMESWLWADGYTLQYYLLDKAIRWDLAIGFWLAQHWFACVVFSVMTMLLELGYPIVLVFSRLKIPFIIGGLMMHVGILITMNINFLFFFGYNYFAFLEWPWLMRVVGRAKVGANALGSRVVGPALPRWQLAAMLFFIAVQAGSVFFRIEKWPLSDFRVFRERRHPVDVNALYFAKASDPADPEWLPFWENYFLQRGISWRPARLIREAGRADDPGVASRKRADASELMYLGIFRTDPTTFERNGDLMVMQKRPIFDSAKGEYVVVTEHVMDLEAPPTGEIPR
jgi:hypothetical protein